VTADSEADDNTGQVIIRFTDTGPGFTEDQLDKFNRPLSGVGKHPFHDVPVGPIHRFV
jgi:signal transduction histidine kinase